MLLAHAFHDSSALGVPPWALAIVAAGILTVAVAFPRRAEEPRLLLPPGREVGEAGREVLEVEGWRPRRRRAGLVVGAVLAIVLAGLLVVGLVGPTPPRPNLAALVLGVAALPLLVVACVAGGDVVLALRPPRPAPAEVLPAAPAWAAPALAVPLVLLRTAGRLGGREVAALVGVYLLATTAGRLRCGPGWWRDGDAVAVLSRALSRLSPVERREDAWRRRPWPAGLGTPLEASERAVIGVVLAGALARAATWLPVVVRAGSGQPTWAVWLLDVGLIAYALAVLALVDRAVRTTRGVAVGVALVPVVAALLLANDAAGAIYTALVAVPLLSDPLGTGADLFGTADRRVGLGVLTSPLTWLAQLVLVLVGAIIGATAQRDLDRSDGVSSPVGPLVVALVAGGAIALLLAG